MRPVNIKANIIEKITRKGVKIVINIIRKERIMYIRMYIRSDIFSVGLLYFLDIFLKKDLR